MAWILGLSRPAFEACIGHFTQGTLKDAGGARFCKKTENLSG